LVVLTAHFDSFIVGMVGLGLCGRKTSVTTSNVYEHEQVHSAVSAFFNRKYRGAEKFLNGGKFMHVETSLRAFYKALQRKETVVVVADVPATLHGQGEWLTWFGKQRKVANQVESMTVIGDVQGKNVVIVDDMCDTAGTLCKAAEVMMQSGALSVRAICTHPVFSGQAYERIQDSVLKEMIVTNSIPLKADRPQDKIKVLNIAALFGGVLTNLIDNRSISSNFIIS
jgi:ribose-phosphate pyrophosphokinase